MLRFLKSSPTEMPKIIKTETLSGDRQYSRSITIDQTKVHSIRELKKVLGVKLGLLADRFDIVKMADVLLYDDQERLPDNLASPLHIIVHPAERTVFDHLVTPAKDMINDFEDDDRTMMSCGHGIVPDNLYDLCWNNLKQGAVEFQCPAIEQFNVRGNQAPCGEIWTFYEVTIKAQLSVDERILFEMRLSKNSIQKEDSVQECPFCRCLSVRANEKNNRVRCLNCSHTNPDRSEFCWQCLHQWKDSHAREFCGNLQCSTAKGVHMSQEILRTCAKKTIDNYANVPAVRACPSCHALVEHERGCKRMTCKCTFQFCFVCVKPWTSEGCGYNKTCSSVAPCQVVSK